MDREKLKQLLIAHEGLRLKPYRDTVGILTIGVGRNLEASGITEKEAMFLLDNDIARVVGYCREAFPWFNGLCDTRQNVVCSMVFNLGAAGFSKFQKMIAAIERKDFEAAANEMLCSRWSGQVGARATELSEMMRSGDTFH